jgi:hypothetical protein
MAKRTQHGTQLAQAAKALLDAMKEERADGLTMSVGIAGRVRYQLRYDARELEGTVSSDGDMVPRPSLKGARD